MKKFVRTLTCPHSTVTPRLTLNTADQIPNSMVQVCTGARFRVRYITNKLEAGTFTTAVVRKGNASKIFLVCKLLRLIQVDRTKWLFTATLAQSEACGYIFSVYERRSRFINILASSKEILAP